MVVRNDNGDASSICRSHPGNTGYTIVHCHQQVGRLFLRQLHYLRRQSVTVLKSIGHQVIHLPASHGPQRQYGQRTTGGAITIEITHDQNVLIMLQGIGQ